MAFFSDRPLQRTLFKIVCTFLFGGRRAHFHAYLPSLSIRGRAPGAPGSVVFRGHQVLQLRDATALSERAGSDIVIIGSGPSVRGQDLSGLPQRSAILLNGAISLIGGPVAEPLAVAVEDERFVWRHFAMMRNKIGEGTLCLFSTGVMRALCELDIAWLSRRTVVLIDDIRKPYEVPRRKMSELRAFDFVTVSDDEAGFSADPDQGVFQGGSVAISALQFALRTQARRIGFIGIDISNADTPRFYETAGDVAFSGIAGAEQRILGHFALAKAFAEKKGVTLVNHSPVSALRSIGLDYQPLANSFA